MPAAKDYLAMRTVEPGDKVDYGVKGMRWGVHNTVTRARVAAAKKVAGKGTHVVAKHPVPKHVPVQVQIAKKVAGPEAKVEVVKTQEDFGHESSPARYDRLRAEARAGKASSMTDQDLKFFNARTEAIAKINKMNEVKPGWLKSTLKDVAQQTIKQQLGVVAVGAAGKYASGPLLEALKGDGDKAKLAESSTAIDYVGKHRAKKK